MTRISGALSCSRRPPHKFVEIQYKRFSSLPWGGYNPDAPDDLRHGTRQLRHYDVAPGVNLERSFAGVRGAGVGCNYPLNDRCDGRRLLAMLILGTRSSTACRHRQSDQAEGGASRAATLPSPHSGTIAMSTATASRRASLLGSRWRQAGDCRGGHRYASDRSRMISTMRPSISCRGIPEGAHQPRPARGHVSDDNSAIRPWGSRAGAGR